MSSKQGRSQPRGETEPSKPPSVGIDAAKRLGYKGNRCNLCLLKAHEGTCKSRELMLPHEQKLKPNTKGTRKIREESPPFVEEQKERDKLQYLKEDHEDWALERGQDLAAHLKRNKLKRDVHDAMKMPIGGKGKQKEVSSSSWDSDSSEQAKKSTKSGP